MKRIYIRGGDAKEKGALILKEHLENKGHFVTRRKDNHDYDVVVCWGASMRDPAVDRVPALNANVNLYNKFQALERFEMCNVLIPEVKFYNQRVPPKEGPWFGRNFHHEKGKDILTFKTWEEVQAAVPKDFYTRFVPNDKELRAWVYKDRVFAAYQKMYRIHDIENYKRMEFRSELQDDLLYEAKFTKPAVDAVKCLKMDFGAVDILHGEDGKYYVLEVNSMPDISSNIRVSGIRLAKIVHDWAEAQ